MITILVELNSTLRKILLVKDKIFLCVQTCKISVYKKENRSYGALKLHEKLNIEYNKNREKLIREQTIDS